MKFEGYTEVTLSIRMSIRPSVHVSRNLVQDITSKISNLKLHTQIGHIVEK